MALITDPDFLSQGLSTAATGVTFGAPTGSVVIISGTGMPGLAAGDYFEIRNANQEENNGLYIETGGSPTTTVITATKVAGTNGGVPIADAVSSATTFLHDDGALTEEKSVYFDVYQREIWLLKQGTLTDDGATLQAIYSFTKEEWKNDNALIFHPFPFVAITPEQFEMQSGWAFHTGTDAGGVGVGDVVQDIETRKLVRTGGWREIAGDGTLLQEHISVITLGNFEDNTNDLAYFQQGDDPTDTTAATPFTFTGPVNESVRSYYYATTTPADAFVITGTNTITRTSGSWVTDGYRVGGQITIVTSDTPGNLGTFQIASLTATVLTVVGTGLTNDAADATFTSAVNNRSALNVFLRSDYLFLGGDTVGKTYAQQALSDIGVTELDNKVFRFPLSNVLDLAITNTDTAISTGATLSSGNGTYDDITIKYFDGAFSRDVDDPSGSNPRDFGIVIEIGVHTGIDGSTSGSILTSADGNILAGGEYNGGVLTIHEGADKGSYVVVSHTATSVTVAETFTGATGASFTVQRDSSPENRVLATTNEIYEKVQWLLRQDANINTHNSPAVTGKTADALLRFVGVELESGQAIPSNPNGGGSGVIIEGLLDHVAGDPAVSTSSNDFTFFTNAGTARTFPFVASGSIAFNNNLQIDTDAKFWMFFTYTKRATGVTFSISGASGSTAILGGAGATLPVLVDDQYIRISGFANKANNGLYRVADASPDTTDVTVFKSDGTILVNETAGATVNIDEDPIDSPSAIIVNDNDGAPITGPVSAQTSKSFTFDYDNNAQGNRTAGDGDAAVTIRAIGFSAAQFVEVTGTIAQTGNNFSLVAALERNYSNVA